VQPLETPIDRHAATAVHSDKFCAIRNGLSRSGVARRTHAVSEKNVGAPTFKVILEVFTDR
jgi:hypothetical protein